MQRKNTLSNGMTVVLGTLALGALPLSVSAGTLVQSGFLVDANDQSINNAALPAQFSLHATETGSGTPLWSSGACQLDVRSGRYATRLGADCGSDIPASVLTPGAPRWLELSVGGITLSPRVRLGDVPTAADSARLEGLAASAFWKKSEAVDAATLGGSAAVEFWKKSDAVDAASVGGVSLTGLWKKSDAVDAATVGGVAPSNLWKKSDAVDAATVGGIAPSNLWKRSDAVDAASVGGQTLTALDSRYLRTSGGGTASVSALSVTSALQAGTVTATSFSGSGAGLTDLPASAITGSIPLSALPAQVARRDQANTFTGAVSAAGITSTSGLSVIAGTDTHQSIRLHNAATNKTWNIYQLPTADSSPHGLLFENFADGSFQRRLTILDNGNVGINTTNPSQRLEVSGTVKASAFVGDGSGLTGVSAASVAAPVYNVSGQHVLLYTTPSEETAQTNPLITVCGTRGNVVGCAYFQLLGSNHCGYCYSGGPKAVIYETGNLGYSFHTSGGNVYLSSPATHFFRITSSYAINPTAVSSIPGGALTVARVN